MAQELEGEMLQKQENVKYFATVDIGGTAIKYGIISADEKIIFKSKMPTQAEQGPNVWMNNVATVINEMKEKYSLQGICVSSTAMIDSINGRVFFSLPQMPDYTGFEIKKFLEEKCNLITEVENDVNCVALAESVSGAGKGYSSVLCLTIGTGIGGGFTENNHLLRGATFSACEVGYIRVGDSDLEHLGSTTALCRRVEKYKGAKPFSWGGVKVFDEAKKGDADCVKAIDIMAFSIAQGLVSLSYILNPSVIVLGGGVMSEENLLDQIRSYFNSLINPLIAQNTKIVSATYKNDAGLVGAFYHFKEKHPEIFAKMPS